MKNNLFYIKFSILIIIIISITLPVSSKKISPGVVFLKSLKDSNRLDRVSEARSNGYVNENMVKVAIVFKTPPSADELNDLKGLGISFNNLHGKSYHSNRVFGAYVPWSSLEALEKQEFWEMLSL